MIKFDNKVFKNKKKISVNKREKMRKNKRKSLVISEFFSPNIFTVSQKGTEIVLVKLAGQLF